LLKLSVEEQIRSCYLDPKHNSEGAQNNSGDLTLFSVVTCIVLESQDFQLICL